MASMNKVFLAGNVTKNVELKRLNNAANTAVAEISLAINDRVKKGTDYVDEVTYVDIVTWGKTAENCSEYLSKGSGILCEARLKLDVWQDKTTGKNMQKLKVVADKVTFLDKKTDRSEPQTQRQEPAKQQTRQSQEDSEAPF